MGKQDYEEEEEGEDMQDHEKEDMQDREEEEEDKPLVVLLMDMPCYSMNNS